MKRLFVVLACAGLLAGMTSCKKTCECTTWTNGTAATAVETDLAEGKDKCADMTTFVTEVDSIKTGIECK